MSRAARGLEALTLEVLSAASVAEALAWGPEAIVHLAAVASVREAGLDPGAAWDVNAGGTARLAAAAARLQAARMPTLLVISTGEVYGAGTGAPPGRDRSAAAPVALRGQQGRRGDGGARDLAAHRPPGGDRAPVSAYRGGASTQFVVPAFAARLRDARRSAARTVATGNLEPVRDLLDVRDAVAAYRLLLARGTSGEAYNVAGERGSRWRRCSGGSP